MDGISKENLDILENNAKKIKVKITKVILKSEECKYGININIFYKKKKIIKNIFINIDSKEVINYILGEQVKKIKTNILNEIDKYGRLKCRFTLKIN